MSELDIIMSTRKKKKHDVENFENRVKTLSMTSLKYMDVFVNPSEPSQKIQPLPELSSMRAWKKNGEEWIEIPVEKMT